MLICRTQDKYLLMFQYMAGKGWFFKTLSGEQKICPTKNFQNIMDSVIFFLTRGQMCANEAERGVIQCHTDRYRSLQIAN